MVLIWAEKPLGKECIAEKIELGIFICGKKCIYDYNMQVFCVFKYQFIAVWIQKSTSVSNFIFVLTFNLYQHFKMKGFLAAGFALF